MKVLIGNMVPLSVLHEGSTELPQSSTPVGSGNVRAKPFRDCLVWNWLLGSVSDSCLR